MKCVSDVDYTNVGLHYSIGQLCTLNVDYTPKFFISMAPSPNVLPPTCLQYFMQGEITEPELRLRAVLREWYTGDVNHCWESVWSALQAIGHERLAESIAVKYRTNHLHA